MRAFLVNFVRLAKTTTEHSKSALQMGSPLAEYHLLTIWRIEAPVEQVYEAIENSLRWPKWWPGVRDVQQRACGAPNGLGNIRRYVWQSKWLYRVMFDVCATRIQKLVAIEGTVEGDLSGVGRWSFSKEGSVCVVHYDWHVNSMRWWMNFTAPFLHSMFIRNHIRIMEQGGEALANLLFAPLVGQLHLDLCDLKSHDPRWPRKEKWIGC